MSLAFILWRMNYYRINDMRNAELSGEGVCVWVGGGGEGGWWGNNPSLYAFFPSTLCSFYSFIKIQPEIELQFRLQDKFACPRFHSCGVCRKTYSLPQNDTSKLMH